MPCRLQQAWKGFCHDVTFRMDLVDGQTTIRTTKRVPLPAKQAIKRMKGIDQIAVALDPQNGILRKAIKAGIPPRDFLFPRNQDKWWLVLGPGSYQKVSMAVTVDQMAQGNLMRYLWRTMADMKSESM